MLDDVTAFRARISPVSRIEALASAPSPGAAPDLQAYAANVLGRLAAVADPAVLSDPWSFKDWLVGADGEADGGDRPARSVLLHEVHPEAFEAIASPEEKQAIADALGALAD